MRKIAAVGLLIVAALTFFPPVRSLGIERVPRWTGRTCLLASEIYVSRRGSGSLTEDTAIDLPRLACEILFVGSLTGFVIVLRVGKQPEELEESVDAS